MSLRQMVDWRVLFSGFAFVVLGWLVGPGFVGCFSAPDLQGFPCTKDADCLVSTSQCSAGFCQRVGAEPSSETSTEQAPDTSTEMIADTPPDTSCSKTKCNDRCVDLQTDSANCGACGTACSTGKACVAGECVQQAYKSCTSDSECAAPFVCTQTNSFSQTTADQRCLKPCSFDSDCVMNEEICSKLSDGQPSFCFTNCQIDTNTGCKHLGDHRLFCVVGCVSGTCTGSGTDKDLKCGIAAGIAANSYACINVDKKPQCITTCKNDASCPSGYTCKCPEDKPTCEPAGPRYCLK